MRKPVDPVILIGIGLALAGAAGAALRSSDAEGLGWAAGVLAGVVLMVGAVAQGVALGLAWYRKEFEPHNDESRPHPEG